MGEREREREREREEGKKERVKGLTRVILVILVEIDVILKV